MDRHPLQSRFTVTSRISDLIGCTPLLELLTTRFGTRVLLKLEQFNPTGTAKIRMARQMIDEAEQQGLLRPGGWIVESTSGNTGMGLALIAAERGYRAVRLDVIQDNFRARALYERQGFQAVRTEELGVLRFLFGFASSTTMVRPLGQPGE